MTARHHRAHDPPHMRRHTRRHEARTSPRSRRGLSCNVAQGPTRGAKRPPRFATFEPACLELQVTPRHPPRGRRTAGEVTDRPRPSLQSVPAPHAVKLRPKPRCTQVCPDVRSSSLLLRPFHPHRSPHSHSLLPSLLVLGGRRC